jgi:basic membrane lipoprotein Med (substrate-binding protein (PBP1-ABC) superfamily)
VWAISGDGAARPGEHVLASVFKDWDNAVYTAVHAFAEGILPERRDVVLSLDGYNVGLEMSAAIAPSIQSRVVELCSDLRVHSGGARIPIRTEP